MPESLERRLPVYLLLDCSESMVGDGLQFVQQGVTSIVKELRGDPQALETVWLSAITFSNRAELITPLCELDKFVAPALRARPGTAIGAALDLLCDRVRAEVRPNTPTQKGDWRPVAFLLTDGSSTDEWEDAARRVRSLRVNLVAIACGPDADLHILSRITESVVALQGYSSGDFMKLFRWISSSVTTASRRVMTKGDAEVALADLPQGVLSRPTNGKAAPPARSGLPREMFLAVRCTRTKQPYLLRHHLNTATGSYQPVRTHVIDDGYLGAMPENSATSAVSTDRIGGALPCPHCGNPVWGRCTCGALLCLPASECTVVCPGCGSSSQFAPMSFDVSGRKG